MERVYSFIHSHEAVNAQSIISSCSVSRSSSLTNDFSRFVLSLIDEVLERLFHDVDKLVVPVEADGHHVVQSVFEVYTQQMPSNG